MTMALLSLLLGCSTAPAPASPVAVVVEHSSSRAAGDYLGCFMKPFYLDLLGKGFTDDDEYEYALHRVKKGVECCTHNGGEHVGWKTVHHDDGRVYPVCLYR